MNKFYFSIIVACLFGSNSLAQEVKNTSIINPADIAKMIVAKQNLYAGDFAGALKIYFDVEKGNQNNESVKFYMGQCFFNLSQMDKAKENLQKAIALNPKAEDESRLFLGKIYHLQGDVANAIKELNEFKLVGNTTAENLREVELQLAQCEVAQQLIEKKWDIDISNLGSEFNSKYDDKNPCITADGKHLVFTSRRPENANALVDIEGDGKYFENIYISEIDTVEHQFKHALLIPGNLNSLTHDAATSITADGKQIYVYKNDPLDKLSRGGNVFISKLSNGKWHKPTSLGKPINTNYWEGGACVSPDGKKIFFTSERPGGLGGSDIWMLEKINKKEWGKPINLGSDINSEYDEGGIFLAPDGKTLFFCNNGPKSMGGYDIFKSSFENGKWSSPINVGYPINSVNKEGQITLDAHAQIAYFSSDRPGGVGENDLYKVDLKDYAILEKDGKAVTSNGIGIMRGTIRESFEGYGVPDVEVSILDNEGKIILTSITNEQGEYFLTLRNGIYKIRINKNGFTEINETIDMQTNSKKRTILEKGFLLKKG